MVVWSKLPTWWIKLNVDGSYRGNLGSSGGGGVLWVEHGILWVAFLEKFDDGINNGAELQAMITKIKLCKQLGFQHVIMEFDFELIVGWITKKPCSAWYLWDYWDGL